jgi:D-alanyl-lipoteichoic acid acyltransferase DltB (MBOAT superfamily)
LAPASTLRDFLLYVAFFPQLVAGPIERAEHLLPQLADLRRPPLAGGWTLIALGAFKKAVIADRMAPLVAAAYADPSTAYGPALWLGTYAFAAQIYCDFSGYSDIAVGIARLLGIELTQNFRSPYAADDPSDFWQRWHISLSSWLRDYLYIPLGGNRGGAGRTARNLALTMLLGGLWHGAAWNFVLWGAYHGALLLLFRAPIVQRWTRWAGFPPIILLRRICMFHIVCLSWVLFRAETLSACGALWSRMLDFGGWELGAWFGELGASGEARYLALMFAVIVAIVALQNALRADSKALATALERAPAPARLAVIVALFVGAVLLCPETPPPFIYFQF